MHRTQSSPSRFQFGLSFLFVVTTFCAVVFAEMRLLGVGWVGFLWLVLLPLFCLASWLSAEESVIRRLRPASLVKILVVCVLAWTVISLFRTVPVARHLRPSESLPGVFQDDYSYCSHRPFVRKFLHRLFLLDWPGNYRCPDHPDVQYIEEPEL